MANQAVIKGNSLLLPDEVDMLLTLRMGRDFAQLTRESYGRLSLKNSLDFAEDNEEAESISLNNSL